MHDAIEDLYIARWGQPTRRARFEDGLLVVEVVKWDEAVTDEGVTLYATLGGSSAEDKVSHTQEFILGLSASSRRSRKRARESRGLRR